MWVPTNINWSHSLTLCLRLLLVQRCIWSLRQVPGGPWQGSAIRRMCRWWRCWCRTACCWYPAASSSCRPQRPSCKHCYKNRLFSIVKFTWIRPQHLPIGDFTKTSKLSFLSSISLKKTILPCCFYLFKLADQPCSTCQCQEGHGKMNSASCEALTLSYCEFHELQNFG